MPDADQREKGFLFNCFPNAYDQFRRLVDAVVDARFDAVVVRGDHYRILEIGAGEAPTPYLVGLFRQRPRGLFVTLVDQDGRFFENSHWRAWFDSIRPFTQFVNDETAEVPATHNALVLRGGEDIFDVRPRPGSHSSNGPAAPPRVSRSFDLILLNAVVHELHKGQTASRGVRVELTLPPGIAPDWTRCPEDVRPNREPDGRIGWDRLLFEESDEDRPGLDALAPALAKLSETNRRTVLQRIRAAVAHARMTMIRALFDQLALHLDARGELLVGDHYFPQWIPLKERVEQVKRIKDSILRKHGLDEIHRDPGDFFLDPARVLACATTPLPGHYARERGWTLCRSRVPQAPADRWLSQGCRAIFHPEGDEAPGEPGIERDGRAFYLARLVRFETRFSIKQVMEDYLQARSRVTAMVLEARSRLVAPERREEELRKLLLGSGAAPGVYASLAREMGEVIRKWRDAQHLEQCESIDIWFGYESSLLGGRRIVGQPRDDEQPPGVSLTRPGTGIRLVFNPDRGQYDSDSGAMWSAQCYNAGLAPREWQDREHVLPTYHDWVVGSNPQVATKAQIEFFGPGAKPAPLRSLTLFTSAIGDGTAIDGEPDWSPGLRGETLACRSAGEPQHVYVELNTEEPACSWADKLNTMLLDGPKNDREFPVMVEAAERPLQNGDAASERLYSAFVAAIMGAEFADDAVGPKAVWGEYPRDAYVPAIEWLDGERRKRIAAGYRFPRFITMIPLAQDVIDGERPAAEGGGVVGTLMLFTTQPLAGALLNMLSVLCGSVFSRLRELEQDIRMDDATRNRVHKKYLTSFGHDAKRPAEVLSKLLRSGMPDKMKLALAPIQTEDMKTRAAAYSSLIPFGTESPLSQLKAEEQECRRLGRGAYRRIGELWLEAVSQIVLRSLVDDSIWSDFRSVLWSAAIPAADPDRDRSPSFWSAPLVARTLEALARQDPQAIPAILPDLGIECASEGSKLLVPAPNGGRPYPRLHTALRFIFGELFTNYVHHTLHSMSDSELLTAKPFRFRLHVDEDASAKCVSLRLMFQPGMREQIQGLPPGSRGTGLLSIDFAADSLGAGFPDRLPTTDKLPRFAVEEDADGRVWNVWTIQNIPSEAFSRE